MDGGGAGGGVVGAGVGCSCARSARVCRARIASWSGSKNSQLIPPATSAATRARRRKSRLPPSRWVLKCTCTESSTSTGAVPSRPRNTPPGQKFRMVHGTAPTPVRTSWAGRNNNWRVNVLRSTVIECRVTSSSLVWTGLREVCVGGHPCAKAARHSMLIGPRPVWIGGLSPPRNPSWSPITIV